MWNLVFQPNGLDSFTDSVFHHRRLVDVQSVFTARECCHTRVSTACNVHVLQTRIEKVCNIEHIVGVWTKWLLQVILV